jgi:hypothetical protein
MVFNTQEQLTILNNMKPPEWQYPSCIVFADSCRNWIWVYIWYLNTEEGLTRWCQGGLQTLYWTGFWIHLGVWSPVSQTGSSRLPSWLRPLTDPLGFRLYTVFTQLMLVQSGQQLYLGGLCVKSEPLFPFMSSDYWSESPASSDFYGKESVNCSFLMSDICAKGLILILLHGFIGMYILVNNLCHQCTCIPSSFPFRLYTDW